MSFSASCSECLTQSLPPDCYGCPDTTAKCDMSKHCLEACNFKNGVGGLPVYMTTTTNEKCGFALSCNDSNLCADLCRELAHRHSPDVEVSIVPFNGYHYCKFSRPSPAQEEKSETEEEESENLSIDKGSAQWLWDFLSLFDTPSTKRDFQYYTSCNGVKCSDCTAPTWCEGAECTRCTCLDNVCVHGYDAKCITGTIHERDDGIKEVCVNSKNGYVYLPMCKTNDECPSDLWYCDLSQNTKTEHGVATHVCLPKKNP